MFAAYESARAAGFDNMNLDFMFGLPEQAMASWEDTLARAVALGPEHLSLYSLIVEPDTPLFRWVEAGKVDEPDEDLAGDLYEAAMAWLAGAGYVQYEVSNWAKPVAGEIVDAHSTPAQACRHNLVYWRNGEYAAIGRACTAICAGAAPAARRFRGDGATCARVPEYVRRMEALDAAWQQTGAHGVDTQGAVERIRRPRTFPKRLTHADPWAKQ